jgi:hypothetical protein
MVLKELDNRHAHLGRSGRGHDLLLVWWRRRQGCEGRSAGVPYFPVQQAGLAAVDVLTVEEGASLATLRWCRSRDYRRRAMLGCCCPC